jgi:hypothetical protein
MKTIKKSYGRIISFLLLLCFGVAIVPFDFLHSHAETKQVCNEVTENGYCTHKLHLSEKAKSCFACAVHYNKTFDKPTLSDKVISFPAINILAQNRVTGYFIKLIFTALRGPPSE